MRSLTLLLIMTVAGCAVTDPGQSPANETSTSVQEPAVTTETTGTTDPARAGYRVLASGSYGRLASSTADSGRRAPWVVAAEDEQTYRRAWSDNISSDDPPAVDFSRETVVFMLLGRRSTGGYSIDFKGTRYGADTLVLNADLKGPGSDSIVTQAFTAPYLVVAVPLKGIDRVDWVSEDRLLARFNREAK